MTEELDETRARARVDDGLRTLGSKIAHERQPLTREKSHAIVGELNKLRESGYRRS